MNKNISKNFTMSLLGLFLFFTVSCAGAKTNTQTVVLEEPGQEELVVEAIAEEIAEVVAPEPKKERNIRGIHLTAAISGANKQRDAVIEFFNDTEMNTAVIDIKEMEGHVYIDGVKSANSAGAYRNLIPNVSSYIARLKENNIYTIARIVVFRDNFMPRKKTSFGVKNPDGSLWQDRKGITWVDPYNKEAWEYIFEICDRAVEIGFDEIQFDYIRFPSDGPIKNCRYSNKEHSSQSATKAIVDFLKAANERLKPKKIKISIDVFGLTTTSKDDMGIGQKIVEMTEWVDYVSPMVYPSHYYKGMYGLAEPNKEPYTVVYKAMEGAMKKLPKEKLRPWLQDFTMFGYKYGKEQVRAQIQACYDLDIPSWLLWNARCVYTRDALLGEDAEAFYEKSDPPTSEMIKTQKEKEKKEEAQKAAADAEEKPDDTVKTE